MRKLFVLGLGVVVGALLFSTSLSFAASGQKKVEVTYSNIKVVVDGKLVNSSQEPFIMNNSVYVPLRVIAETLNQEVGWENKTVLIGTGSQSLLLTDLISPSLTGLKVRDKSLTVGGKVLNGFYVVSEGQRPTANMRFFMQNKGIKEVKGALALDDSNPDGIQPVDVRIKVDNKEVWEGTLRKGENPLPISFKIGSEANNIVVEFSNLSNTKVDFINFIGVY